MANDNEVKEVKISKYAEQFKDFDMVKGLKPMLNSYQQKLENIKLIDMNRPFAYDEPLRYKHWRREDIRKFLKNPEHYERQLREVSDFLFEVSPQYRRLIMYFSTLLTLDYTISPIECEVDETEINREDYIASYKKYCNYMNNMNIKHEMIKILTEAWRDDIYYGYKRESKYSVVFQRLDPDYCKITSLEDSTCIYSFNFSYFDKYPEKLSTFAPEFATMYEKYKENPKDFLWQEPPSKNQFCLKINESIIPAPVIPFAGVFDYVYRILDYTDLQETADELDNYKIIGLKIPFDADNGEIQLDLDLAKQFYNQLCNVLPQSVGAFMTPMDFDDISFDRNAVADSDLTTNATENFWNSAGVSSLLFGTGQTSSSLNVSIKADTMLAISVGEQIERIINRILRQNLTTKVKFKINILPLTIYNQKEMNDLYIKNAQYGIPCKHMLAASLGMTPNEVANNRIMENEIFNFSSTWQPLPSSFTQSSDGEAGRPVTEGDVISDSNENTREHESNLDR